MQLKIIFLCSLEHTSDVGGLFSHEITGYKRQFKLGYQSSSIGSGTIINVEHAMSMLLKKSCDHRIDLRWSSVGGEFAKKGFSVTGYDINQNRFRASEWRRYPKEVENLSDLSLQNLKFTMSVI